MSYEYARIAMKPGLNLICGPNGSGKSSILLAISVALGQIYTERSRKLSDLIRWGKDIARVSLTFEKLEKEKSDSYEPTESFTLSRYLKSDGTYWYESDFRTISKNELLEILSEFGINANNMLIIMHQNMIEEFSVTTPQQKLLMVEDAVGFQFYREKIFDAQNKLTKLLSEEESVAQLLENATQTLAFWKGEYDKYLKRKQLLDRKKTLEIELAWSQAIRMERAALSLKEKLSKKEKALGVNASKIGEIKDSIEKSKQALFEIRSERRKLFSRLIETVRSETNTDTRAQVRMDLESKLDHLFKTVGSFSEKTHSQESQAVMVEVDEIRSYASILLKNEGQSKEELTQTVRDLENQIA
ncbi:MAG TPA: AAA family ATPase, partial [Candidatus Bathyarchaeia archaeon]|nr:AAA family ATPase [Candidatus Bathyarchaeia archaeon]